MLPGKNAPPVRFMVTLAALADHPNTAVLGSLVNGPLRFKEVLATMPSTAEDTVSEALRELDTERLVARRVEPGPPLRVVYELTSLGTELASPLRTLAAWTKDRTAESSP